MTNDGRERGPFSVATDDGGAIVVVGLEPPAVPPKPARDDGTLGSWEVAALEWAGDAVAAGITFETLRSFAVQLVESGWRPRSEPPSIESVSAAVISYLTSVGYLDIRLTEVRRVGEQGWSIAGTADGADLHGRADPAGRLLHVRVA
jgi:hypothetical protein